jgi:zinc protease
VRPSILGALAALAPLAAAWLPAAADSDSGLFGARSATLDNGLEIVVVENHRAPVVMQMLVYKAGGADAPVGKSGIAHFLEHLMFKGTRDVPAGEFSHRVALMGGEDNAFTTEDYTAFHQTAAVEHLAAVMALEADRMANLSLSDSDLLSERDVIIEERRERVDDDPESRLDEMMQAQLFLNHPYRLPVLGWEHEMHGLDRADALAFYRRWYAPNNAVLVVVGDTTLDQVRAIALRTYGQVPSRPVPLRLRLKEPPAYAARRLVLSDVSMHQASWHRLYLAPAYREGSNRDAPSRPYALDLLAEILGGGATSRLYRQLVVEQRLADGVNVDYQGDYLDYGRFALNATPPAGEDSDKLGAAIDQAIAKLLVDGVTPAELKAAKARLAAEAIKARDGLAGPAEVIGEKLATGQSLAEIEAWPRSIAAVDVADVLAAARAVLRPENSVTGLLQPSVSR